MERRSVIIRRRHRRQRRWPPNTIRHIAFLSTKRRTCKVSGSVNVADGTVVYDKPPKSLDLSHFFSNSTLQLFNGPRHRHTIIFVTFGDGDDVFLKLSILSALLRKGFS